jgi:hypothetical protein
MAVRDLTEAEVTFTCECEPEDVPFVGNCSAHDDETDRKQEEWVRDQLDGGNEWAWCHVIVRAAWKGFEGTASLGCCSYLSREDFMRPGGYYDDMKAEALADLNRAVREAAEELAEVIE